MTEHSSTYHPGQTVTTRGHYVCTLRRHRMDMEAGNQFPAFCPRCVLLHQEGSEPSWYLLMDLTTRRLTLAG